MAKKRKSVASSLDEVDRTLYSTFSTAANSLSQLYSQAMSQQKFSFMSGERHGLEMLYQWISKQQAEGLRVTPNDILAYIETELESPGEEPISTPRTSVQNQHHTNPNPNPNPFTVSDSSTIPPNTIGDQQPKNYIFSNALSSPVRRSLQNYHISQEGYSSMDMHDSTR